MGGWTGKGASKLGYLVELTTKGHACPSMDVIVVRQASRIRPVRQCWEDFKGAQVPAKYPDIPAWVH